MTTDSFPGLLDGLRISSQKIRMQEIIDLAGADRKQKALSTPRGWRASRIMNSTADVTRSVNEDFLWPKGGLTSSLEYQYLEDKPGEPDPNCTFGVLVKEFQDLPPNKNLVLEHLRFTNNIGREISVLVCAVRQKPKNDEQTGRHSIQNIEASTTSRRTRKFNFIL